MLNCYEVLLVTTSKALVPSSDALVPRQVIPNQLRILMILHCTNQVVPILLMVERKSNGQGVCLVRSGAVPLPDSRSRLHFFAGSERRAPY